MLDVDGRRDARPQQVERREPAAQKEAPAPADDEPHDQVSLSEPAPDSPRPGRRDEREDTPAEEPQNRHEPAKDGDDAPALTFHHVAEEEPEEPADEAAVRDEGTTAEAEAQPAEAPPPQVQSGPAGYARLRDDGDVLARREELSRGGGSAYDRYWSGSPDTAASTPQNTGGPLTVDEARRIGTAYGSNQRPPQTLWNEHAVNDVNQAGLEQGGITTEQISNNAKLAQQALNGDGTADPNGPPKQVDIASMAALARDSGADLAKLDPNQLQAAVNYVNGANSQMVAEGDGQPLTLQNQQDRLGKALNNFDVLDKIGMPKLSDQELKDLMWGAAKVPGHAFGKDNIQKDFQDVAAAINNPGANQELKFDDHTVKLSVNQDNTVTSSNTEHDTFLGDALHIAKVALPIAAMVVGTVFTGGAMAAVAVGMRVASAAISAVDAIKKHSVLGALGAVAAGVGAGFAGAASRATGAAAQGLHHVASIANGVSSALRGVNAIRQGGFTGLVGGIAGVAGGVAGAFADGTDGLADTVGGWSQRLGQAASGYGAIQHRDLLSGISTGVSLGSQFVSNDEIRTDMQYAAGGLNVARDIKNHDFASAAVDGFATGTAASDNAHLHDAAQEAQAANNYRLALQAQGNADKAVKDAQAALEHAKMSGDPQSIAQAEQYLKSAKQGADVAHQGTFYAGEDMAQTGQAVGEQLRQERAQAQQEQIQKEVVDGDSEGFAALNATPANAPGGFQEAAQEALDDSSQASDDLNLPAQPAPVGATQPDKPDRSQLPHFEDDITVEAKPNDLAWLQDLYSRGKITRQEFFDRLGQGMGPIAGDLKEPEGFTIPGIAPVVYGDYEHPAQAEAVRAHEMTHVRQWRGLRVIDNPNWELERQGFAAEIPVLENELLNNHNLTQRQQQALYEQLDTARKQSQPQIAREYEKAKPGVLQWWGQFFSGLFGGNR